MFKKVILTAFLFFALVGLTACESNCKRLVEENMSEITKEYYYGQNDEMYASLLVGERESDFLYDGISTKNVDYVLLCVNFVTSPKADAVCVNVTTNDTTTEIELLYKESEDAYLKDIVGAVEVGDYLDISYKGSVLRLEKCNFAISSDEALDIACNYLYDTLNEYKYYNNFYAECYLTVVKEREFEEFYWSFMCIDKEEQSTSILISTADGKVISNL